MSDGWDDDDDYGEDGWGDDDGVLDIIDDTTNPEEEIVFTTSDDKFGHTATKNVSDAAVVPASSSLNDGCDDDGNGWGDDDDGLDDFSDDDDVASPPESPPDQQPVSIPKAPIVAAVSAENDNDGGWDDDDDDDEMVLFENASEDIDDAKTNPAVAAANEIATTDSKVPRQQQQMVITPEISTLCHELANYILNIPHHISSIRAVLEAEYSTVAKAIELLQYYESRPQLEEYTLTKELERMSYTVITHDTQDVLTSSEEIRPYFQQLQHEAEHYPEVNVVLLLLRCANQSLMADMIDVITGTDRIVRPQYHTSAVAQQCGFTINAAECTVEAKVTVHVSLPSNDASINHRWDIATIQFIIIFNTNAHAPSVEYRLADVQLLVSPSDQGVWNHSLEQCSIFLIEMGASADGFAEDDTQQQQSPINFRDVFLQKVNNTNAKAMLRNTAGGMKSAWDDINAATGIRTKLTSIQSILPKTSDIVQLEVEASKSTADSTQHRPGSLLGGLVRSLANTVVIDEDPELYAEWKNPSSQQNVNTNDSRDMPKFYNASAEEATTIVRSDPTSAAAVSSSSKSMFPQLYNKETQSAVPKQSEAAAVSEIPKFYNDNSPKAVPKANVSTSGSGLFPKLYNTNESANDDDDLLDRDDGWDDDDDNNNAFSATTCEEKSIKKVSDVEKAIASYVKPVAKMEIAAALQNWTYDATTDIVPTRTRYRNPHQPSSRVF